MSIIRKPLSAALAAALLTSGATPAFAGGFGGPYVSGGFGFGSGYGGYGRGRRHHRDRVDAGDVVAGIAILGVIAAIASASSKKKQERQTRNGYPPRDTAFGKITSENDAVDACANAVETQGGETASVRDISQVDRTTDGWDVEGVLEQRDNWRDKSAERRRFTCSVRFGEVQHVYIDTGTVALR